MINNSNFLSHETYLYDETQDAAILSPFYNIDIQYFSKLITKLLKGCFSQIEILQTTAAHKNERLVD